MKLETPGVQLSNRVPAGAVVLEAVLLTAVEPYDHEPGPRLPGGESHLAHNTREVANDFAVQGERPYAVVECAQQGISRLV